MHPWFMPGKIEKAPFGHRGIWDKENHAGNHKKYAPADEKSQPVSFKTIGPGKRGNK